MLRNLVVENYALISKLEIEFRRGLTIITGETGAGKSILLGAMSLILGKRADTSVLLDKNRKCIVEGSFDITGYGLREYFTENDIDYDDITLFRREISSSGKSRAFINDNPVNLELLVEFGKKLIDIHSQHQNLNLADSQFQMKVIDSYAHDREKLAAYAGAYDFYCGLQNKFRQLSGDSGKLMADLEYFQFQFNQLHEARLHAGEQEELELEQGKLTHAGEIKSGLSAAASLMEGENAALMQLKECLTLIRRIQQYLTDGENLAGRIESAYIELKDVTRELDQRDSQYYLDPDRLAWVIDRLNLIYTLEKKHNAASVEELVVIREKLAARIAEIGSVDFDLEQIGKTLAEKRNELTLLANELTRMRSGTIGPFEQKITEMLKEVGIPNAVFKVLLQPIDDFNENGLDTLQFLFSANKNMDPQDIARVASGGEISRLMLCIKSMMSDSAGLPTLIFDEIDTGVSGEIAERVGNIIRRMGEKMQIINITHLPQVASKGDHHYLVYKSEDAHTSETRMKLLTPEERHIEIAKMLSGEEITQAALENARALLKS